MTFLIRKPSGLSGRRWRKSCRRNRRTSAIFNQAMMELGATVCGPNTAPRCDDCPVSGLCLGRQRGTAETLPVKKAKKERRVEEKTVFLLMRDRKIALRKRPKTGLLAGLWEFPNVEGTLDETAAGAAVEAVGLSVIDWAEPPDGQAHLHPCGVAHDRLRADRPGRRPCGTGMGGCGRPCGALCAVGVCPVL